jgi:hypothetical protein
MPRVSRANGERIWTVGARCGFLLGAARLAAGRLACGRFEGLFLLLERVDGRDAERRDGEVFVAMAAQSDGFSRRFKHARQLQASVLAMTRDRSSRAAAIARRARMRAERRAYVTDLLAGGERIGVEGRSPAAVTDTRMIVARTLVVEGGMDSRLATVR